MRYKKFIIKGYRGISDVTELDISKESLIPIIGKNESGKTTFLEAIHSFDFLNDKENDGKHLSNVENLYSTIETPIIVAAQIEVDKDFDYEDFFEDLGTIKEEFLSKYPEEQFDIVKVDTEKDEYTNPDVIKILQILTNEITNSALISIERDLRTKKYSFPLFKDLSSEDYLHSLGEDFLRSLPYILYFDDFRDRIEESIYITKDEKSPLYSRWILYIDELFAQTKKDYSVFALPSKSDGIRRSIISEVQKHLNKVLSEEWSKYQFDQKENIEIKIEYLDSTEIPALRFKIVEKVIIEGYLEERFFDISDRSKGFFWYFNFIIKLQFNPSKRDNLDVDTIYLLDEPGSYLHTYALTKLAEQLKRLSQNNKVIYCTHFPNLLNPEFIPINSIRIAEKINKGKIIFKKIDDRGLIRPQRNSAYQPILDALEVRPPLVEYDFDNVVLVEGIYDFYSFKMFTSKSFAYFACVNAASIINQIPYMIFLNKKYLALWDNDEAGRSQLEKAKTLFGEVESEKFLLLEILNNKSKNRLEDYYDNDELENFKDKHFNNTALNFNKTVLALFYSENREKLIDHYFPKTKSNFLSMEKIFQERLNAQIKNQFVAGILDNIVVEKKKE